MLTHFYQIDSGWQIILLVLSQFTLFSFVAGILILYRRGCKTIKLSGIVIAFLLNVVIYVLMQIDSRVTGAEYGLHMHVPYIVLFFTVMLSLIYNVKTIIVHTKGQKTINRNSIKEAFDNLPLGVCFFNEAGLSVLCNMAMQRFSFAVCGRDVQFIADIEICFADDFVPVEGVKKDGTTYILPDGKAWNLRKRVFTHESGNSYTQYTVANVTKLYNNREELELETKHLSEVQEDLQKLSANVVTATREEEILNTKMLVHDEMGRCLIAAQKYLKENNVDNIPDSIASSWQKAVAMLKYSNDTPDEDMLLQIRKTCEFVKLDFIQTGKLPKSEKVAYILTCAVRECVTNAVRYAEATELYADFLETEAEASVILTNNGKRPDGEITEGGGLSSLRARIERAGGQMTVEAFPEFKLTVSVPKRKEGVI